MSYSIPASPRVAICAAELASQQYLPLETEHWAELKPTPEHWLHDSFTAEAVEDGVRCMMARPRGGDGDEQASLEPACYYFDSTKFDAGEAQRWLNDQGIVGAKFTRAKADMYPQLTASACKEITIDGLTARVIRAAGKLPHISIDPLYSGGELNLDGFAVPLVVELAGIDLGDTTSILYAHDEKEPVGQGRAAVAAGRLIVEGEITGTSERARQVVADASNGYQWRASMGVELVGERKLIFPDETLRANGQTFKGPLIYWPKSRLKEASVLGNGADYTSRVSIAAYAKKPTASSKSTFTSRSPKMDEAFVQWVHETYELDAAALADGTRRKMEAAWKKNTNNEAKIADSTTAVLEAHLARFEGRVAEAAAIAQSRVQVAHDQYDRVARMYGLDTEQHRTVRAKAMELRSKALQDKMTPDAIELAFYRLALPEGNTGISSGQMPQFEAKVLEAAFAKNTGVLKDIEKKYDAQTLEAADRKDLRRITLKGMLCRAAQARGWQGRWIEGDDDLEAVLDYAFSRTPRNAFAAESTISLPGIMSNLQNKFLMQGFWGIESVWRDCAFIRSVNDFKPAPAFRFFGNLTFEKLGPNGEIKHGTLGETAYANRAETYAKFLATTRQDIRNDDMGALSMVPQAMGRGAALSLNDIFYSMVLSGKDFFGNAMYFSAAGKDGKGQTINVNKFTGSTSSLLTNAIGALTQARAAFRQQVGPDGKPIGYAPALMIVPPALETFANQVYTSTELRQLVTALGDVGPSTQSYLTENVFKGLFRVLVSAYIGTNNNPAGTTGSDTAWYLLGDQGQIPVWELAFLDGNQAPTVQSSEADFRTLGIVHRGFHDFGAAALEPRGLVYNTGV